MSEEGERIRMVVMGDAKVGKSSILNRFINNSFEVWFDYFKNPVLLMC